MSTTTTVLAAPSTASENAVKLESASDFITISYAKLIEGNAEEQVRLREAAEKDGFWYLDLRGQSDTAVLVDEGTEKVYSIASDFYAQDEDEKLKYDVDQVGPWKLNGKLGVEALSLPRDGICTQVGDDGSPDISPIFTKESPFLASFMNSLHGVGLKLLSVLERDEAFRQNAFTSVHQPSQPSTSCMTKWPLPVLI